MTLKDRLAEASGGAAPGRASAASPRWLVGLAAAGFLAAAAFAALYALRRPSGPVASPIRFAVRAPEGTKFTWLRTQNLFAVSPDGRRIAFVTRGADGRDSLWVRPLAELAAVPLAGTEGAAAPFWSPDSRFIAFFADGKLKKIDASAGPPVTLCDVPSATPSGSWGSQHKILFSAHAEPFVSLVEDAGGAPRAAVKVDTSRQERSVGWPSFLPDGRHFLYVGRGKEEPHTYVRLASLEDGKTAPLLTNCSRAQYVPGDPNAPAGSRSGHLLYARDGSLLAQPFDSDRLRLAGDAIPAGQEIWQHVFIGTGPFSASDNGVLASRGKAGETRLAWIDRAGRETGSLASPAEFEWVRLSRDSRRVVVGRVDPRTGAHDLWVGELPREVLTRLNLGSEDYLAPTWSPDGTRIALSVGSSSRGPNLSWLALHGSVSPEPIIPAGAANQRPTDWSWDGRFLLYTLRSASDAGLWVVNLEGERKSRKLLSVSGEATNQTQAQFSPDGRWIAYCAPESDRSEVYLTSFPEPGERVRVSASGGSRPRWKRDGRELYFVSAGNEMIATPMRLGSSAQVGAPRPLFRMGSAGWQDYDVTADGERFLVIENLPAPEADAIAVTTNWPSLLRR